MPASVYRPRLSECWPNGNRQLIDAVGDRLLGSGQIDIAVRRTFFRIAGRSLEEVIVAMARTDRRKMCVVKRVKGWKSAWMIDGTRGGRGQAWRAAVGLVDGCCEVN